MADHDMDRLNRRIDEIAQKVDGLSASFDKGFSHVNERFDEIDKRFTDIDQRFEQVDKRFDEGFAAIDESFAEQRQYTENAFYMLRTEMRDGFAEMRAGFQQIDRRLALFIETQSAINQSADRRTTALERARRRRKS